MGPVTTGVYFARGAIPPAEDVVFGIYHEHNGVGYVLDAHTYGAPARAPISCYALIPFGTAVTAFVGFCGSSEEVARTNSDNATFPICDPDCVDTANSIDNGDPVMDPESNSERLHGPGNVNDIDTDSILPVLDYESEGSAGSVSSGSAIPAMVGMEGNANATTDDGVAWCGGIGARGGLVL